jgi:hypothetical protein
MILGYFRYIPYRLIGAFKLMGWSFESHLSGPHADYSVLMRAPE